MSIDHTKESQLNKIRISSRSSQLAKIQALMVGDALKKKNPQLEISYEFRESLGDKNLHDPLWKMPQKGVFTEDFYLDLVESKTDMIVHSWKDLPVENKPDTFIAATLPRADQRDLLIFKKDRLFKKDVRLFTSSPRREYNLRPFLLKALPTGVEQIDFVNIRGNVPTRIRKFMNESSVDGLILAKAAVDRFLLSDWSELVEVQAEIKKVLQDQLWMVLPLTVNPNAAAQGALAIEILNSREDLKSVLKEIHCEKTFQAAEFERKTLKSYGGGCHQKIGVTYLNRPYGDLFFLRGLTDQGEILSQRKIIRDHDQTLQFKKIDFEKKWSSSILNEFLKTKDLDFEIPISVQGLFISKISAFKNSKLNAFKGFIWSAGLETWYRLAQYKVWVNGSSEGLGESEDKRVDHMTHNATWAKLTHLEAIQAPSDIATYEILTKQLNPEIKAQISEKLKQDLLPSQFIYWTSFIHYKLIMTHFPEFKEQLKNKVHACGLGSTKTKLEKELNQTPYLFLNEDDFFNTSQF